MSKTEVEKYTDDVQDSGTEKLWKSLHTGAIEPLDLAGLRAGLKRIGHPLASTDKLLEQVFALVDTSKDGKIDYSEFLVFMKQTERELKKLFNSIDKNHNGRLEKAELYEAFRNADLATNERKLDKFFDHVDANHDGEISFDEWRDFLIFIPLDTPDLDAVLSYYNNTIFVGSEGDVSIQGSPGSGIDTFLHTLFRSLFDLTHYRPLYPQSSSRTSRNDIPWDPGESAIMTSTTSDSLAPDLQTMPERESLQKNLLTSVTPGSGYFISGGLAGFFSRTATAPLDRLKVYLIARTPAQKEAAKAAKRGPPTQSIRAAVRSLQVASVQLWRLGGIKSLYAGNGLNVVKVMPEFAMRFGAYQTCKQICARLEGHGDPTNLTFFHSFVSAGTSGAVAQLVVYPLDTLKFRVQCETVAGGPRGNALIFQTARKMFREGGVRAYWRGVALGVAGMFPYSAIDLSTYDYFTRKYIDWKVAQTGCTVEEAKPKGIIPGLLGAMSGSLGATLLYPVNLIRTRMQSQGTVIHPPKYAGWKDCLNKTLKNDGVKGLYKGLTPNLLKVMPAMSISYIVYETSKEKLGVKN